MTEFVLNPIAFDLYLDKVITAYREGRCDYRTYDSEMVRLELIKRYHLTVA